MIIIYQPCVGSPEILEAIDLDDARDHLTDCFGGGVQYTNCPASLEHASSDVKFQYMRLLIKEDLCETT